MLAFDGNPVRHFIAYITAHTGFNDDCNSSKGNLRKLLKCCYYIQCLQR